MRILFLGDVVGRSGRDAVHKHFPAIKAALSPDISIINGENAAAGYGITPKIAADFYALGFDCVTTGNHAWAQREMMIAIETDQRMLRPLNFPEGTPGRGAIVVSDKQGRKALIAQALGRLFMEPMDDPFAAVEKALRPHTLGTSVQAVVVDIHAEATSEKMALAHSLDGRASLVVGTHTHIPTGDAQILPGGTAYMTDAGMCGDFDSVIGARKAISVSRFKTRLPGDRLSPAEGDGTVCGVYVETDDKTGLATRVEPVRVGPRLAEHLPQV